MQDENTELFPSSTHHWKYRLTNNILRWHLTTVEDRNNLLHLFTSPILQFVAQYNTPKVRYQFTIIMHIHRNQKIKTLQQQHTSSTSYQLNQDLNPPISTPQTRQGISRFASNPQHIRQGSLHRNTPPIKIMHVIMYEC